MGTYGGSEWRRRVTAWPLSTKVAHREGARVVLADKDEAGLARVAAEIGDPARVLAQVGSSTQPSMQQ